MSDRKASLFEIKERHWLFSPSITILSSAAIVLGAWGCLTLRNYCKQTCTRHAHSKKRSLEADKNIMRIMKKSGETGNFLGGTLIDGYVAVCSSDFQLMHHNTFISVVHHYHI